MVAKLKTGLSSCLLLGCLAVLSQVANASVISGDLNITGSARVSANKIDFLPAGGSDGFFTVDLFTQTGFFTGLAGTTGHSKDLSQPGQPIGTPFLPANFLTFTSAPTLKFMLTEIDFGSSGTALCSAPAAAGQSCTPAASEFNFLNTTKTSSILGFSLQGTVTDGSGSPVSNFVGTYSTQFTHQNYQQILSELGKGKTVQASYSANFVVSSPVPEPGTAYLGLAGIALLSGARLYRRWFHR